MLKPPEGGQDADADAARAWHQSRSIGGQRGTRPMPLGGRGPAPNLFAFPY
jgi:hypothetical protein